MASTDFVRAGSTIGKGVSDAYVLRDAAEWRPASSQHDIQWNQDWTPPPPKPRSASGDVETETDDAPVVDEPVVDEPVVVEPVVVDTTCSANGGACTAYSMVKTRDSDTPLCFAHSQKPKAAE